MLKSLAFNHQQDTYAYINHFPLHAVSQLHLAGYAMDENENVPLKIDTHDREVSTDVWQLYRHTLQQLGDCPTLIEWDGQLPEFSILQQQAHLADIIRSDIIRSDNQVHHQHGGQHHAGSI
ncbi:DUF692 family protein [Vibrio sp. PP-XX7]